MMMEFREPATWFDKAASLQLVNRWLKAISAILDAEAGCVVINDSFALRVIAGHNVPHAFMAVKPTLHNAPYFPDETVILRDASQRPDIHTLLGTLALERTGFFYRRPLRVTETVVISLVMYAAMPRPRLAQRELALVEEISELIALELERSYPSEYGGITSAMNMSLAEIRSWMEASELPTAMLDADLIVQSINASMRALMPFDWNKLIGRPLADISLPARDGIEFLFRHALETRISTPRLDVALEAAGEDRPRMVRLMGSPIVPVDGELVLIASVDPARIERSSQRSITGFGRHGQEATADFLMETLVRRRALRTRNDMSYVTLRSWRQSIRSHQIEALRALKRNPPQGFAAEIAAEISDDVRSLFGSSFRAVVPMPCSHSSEEKCLSAAIARELGRNLGLPVALALSLPPATGSSHPKKNVNRPAMNLVTPIQGPVLLVDDVATSGRHLEEAKMLLSGAGGSVLSIAWIGGDVVEKADRGASGAGTPLFTR